jgi:hypothetical protein
MSLEVNYVKLLKRFFYLEVGKTQDMPGKICLIVGDALRRSGKVSTSRASPDRRMGRADRLNRPRNDHFVEKPFHSKNHVCGP